MTRRRSPMRPPRSRKCAPILVAALWAGAVTAAEEPVQILPPVIETARTTLPALIVFEVTDLTTTTEAVTGTTRVSFDEALLGTGRAVRISVKADGDLVPQDDGSIPVSNINWETSGAVNGVGMNGVLNKTTYTPVFQSNVLVLSGQVDVVWKLSAPGPAVRAGPHQVTLRWRIESINP
jgi:hypothetical protein